MRVMRLILVLCLGGNYLAGQETRGAISGVVTDAQGAAVPGVSVVVTNTAMNSSSRLTTNGTGYYEAPLLLPGSYQVTAEHPGFRRTVRTGITLAASQKAEINVQLEIGTQTETVSVIGSAPLLDTSAVSSGRSLDTRSIVELPSIGSNPVLFVKMTPGVYSDGTQAYVAQGFTGGTSNYRNPEGVGGNEWSIDGVTNNGGNRNVGSTPNADMLQEMRVETSNFDASFGHGTGMSIAMMTKSGVNAPHGTANWQYYNQRWNAAGFYQKQNYYRQISEARVAGDLARADYLAGRPIQPAGHANALNATLGGPVYIPKIVDGRNKLFFFFNFSLESRPVPNEPDSSIYYTIPTMANREGDFSRLLNIDSRYQVYDPLSVRPDPARATHVVRTPFPGNTIPKNRMINPLYKTYTDLLPRPNDDPLAANLEPTLNYKAFAESAGSHNRLFGNRIDYNLSDKHRFFMRWSRSHFVEDNGGWLYETNPGLQDDVKTRENLSGTLDWTYAANSQTIVNAHVGGTNALESLERTANAKYKPSSVGLPAYLDQQCGGSCALPIMDFSGYTSLGRTPPAPDWWRQFDGAVNVTRIQGTHTLSTGYNTRLHYHTKRNPGAAAGQFGFTNDFTRKADDTSVSPAGTLGLSWAAFMMGIPSSITVNSNADYAIYNPYHAVYVQDGWRITRNLTINLGLRLEYESGPTERFNRMITTFDETASLPIAAAAKAAYALKPLPELPAASLMVQGGPNFSAVNGSPRRFFKGEIMWLPRVSAAWQIGKQTVLRGGYGWYFDTLNVNVAGITQTGFSRSTNTTVSNDFGQTWNVGNPGAGISALADPFPLRADGTRFDAPYGSQLGYMTVAGSSFTGPYDSNRKHPRVQRWRIGVQRQIGSSLVVEAAYVGSYSDRLDLAQNLTSLPEKYWNTTLVRNNALATDLNSNVPNPFFIDNFQSLQSSNPLAWDQISKLPFFTSPTIQKNRLLRELPHMTGLTRTGNPVGKVRNDQFEVSADKRFSHGFNFTFSFTSTDVREKLFLPNEYDRIPDTWITGTTARPYRITATGIYELPFGRGRAFWQQGILSRIAGGWQIAGTAEAQPGALLSWGNLFFYGKLEDIQVENPTLDRWFNTDAGFEKVATKTPTSFQARVFPTRIDGLRADGLKLVNGSVERKIRILEKFDLQIRLDAINVLNRSHFAAPNVTPTSTDFGRVTDQREVINRFIQIQARIRF